MGKSYNRWGAQRKRKYLSGVVRAPRIKGFDCRSVREKTKNKAPSEQRRRHSEFSLIARRLWVCT